MHVWGTDCLSIPYWDRVILFDGDDKLRPCLNCQIDGKHKPAQLASRKVGSGWIEACT